MYNFNLSFCNTLSTSDGGFVLSSDNCLTKIDSQGDTLWTIMCGENDLRNRIDAITINESEEIVVFGGAGDVEKWNWIGVVSADGELLSLNRLGDRSYGVCKNIISLNSKVCGVFYDSGLDMKSDLFKFRSLPSMEIATFDTSGSLHWESKFEFTSGLGNYISPLINPVCFQKHSTSHNKILFVYNLRDFELPEWDLYDPHAYIKPRRSEYQEIMERSTQDTLLLYLTFLDEKGISGQPQQIDSYEKLHRFKSDGTYRLSRRFWFCWEENKDWLTLIENRLIKGKRASQMGYQSVKKLTNHLFFTNWDNHGQFVSEQKIDLKFDYSNFKDFDIIDFRKLPDGAFLLAGELDVHRSNAERWDQDFFLMKLNRSQMIWFKHYGWQERDDYFRDLFISGSDITVVGVSDQWRANGNDTKRFVMKIGSIK